MRTTKQRTAVVEVMQEIDRFQSAKEIHTALQDRNAKVGLTTVYRTLQSLVDIGAVDALHSPTGEVLYRHCESEAHHHHLVCTKCGRTGKSPTPTVSSSLATTPKSLVFVPNAGKIPNKQFSQVGNLVCKKYGNAQ